MRTATSLLAALALTACGTSTETTLETQGIARDATDIPAASIPETDAGFDIAIVTVEGVPRLDDPDFPGAAIDPENRREEEEREDAPEETGEAGTTDMDRVFDAAGTCAPEAVERACPAPRAEVRLDDTRERQLEALAMACESWMARGPSGYAMDITERTIIPKVEDSEVQIDATVCNGATVEAVDVATGAALDAATVSSIDNLYFEAADLVIAGEQVEVTIDPNLSYITRITVYPGEEAEGELFEVTAALRPIGPPVID